MSARREALSVLTACRVRRAEYAFEGAFPG